MRRIFAFWLFLFLVDPTFGQATNQAKIWTNQTTMFTTTTATTTTSPLQMTITDDPTTRNICKSLQCMVDRSCNTSSPFYNATRCAFWQTIRRTTTTIDSLNGNTTTTITTAAALETKVTTATALPTSSNDTTTTTVTPSWPLCLLGGNCPNLIGNTIELSTVTTTSDDAVDNDTTTSSFSKLNFTTTTTKTSPGLNEKVTTSIGGFSTTKLDLSTEILTSTNQSDSSDTFSDEPSCSSTSSRSSDDISPSSNQTESSNNGECGDQTESTPESGFDSRTGDGFSISPFTEFSSSFESSANNSSDPSSSDFSSSPNQSVDNSSDPTDPTSSNLASDLASDPASSLELSSSKLSSDSTSTIIPTSIDPIAANETTLTIMNQLTGKDNENQNVTSTTDSTTPLESDNTSPPQNESMETSVTESVVPIEEPDSTTSSSQNPLTLTLSDFTLTAIETDPSAGPSGEITEPTVATTTTINVTGSPDVIDDSTTSIVSTTTLTGSTNQTTTTTTTITTTITVQNSTLALDHGSNVSDYTPSTISPISHSSDATVTTTDDWNHTEKPIGDGEAVTTLVSKQNTTKASSGSTIITNVSNEQNTTTMRIGGDGDGNEDNTTRTSSDDTSPTTAKPTSSHSTTTTTTKSPSQINNETTENSSYDYMDTTDEYGNVIIEKVSKPKTSTITTTAKPANSTETTKEVNDETTTSEYEDYYATDYPDYEDGNGRTTSTKTSTAIPALSKCNTAVINTQHALAIKCEEVEKGIVLNSTLRCTDPSPILNILNSLLPNRNLNGTHPIGTMIVHSCKPQYLFASIGQPVQIYECLPSGQWTENLQNEPCTYASRSSSEL